MNESFCLALDGGDDPRMTVARVADGNPRGEIEEPVGIDIFHPGSFSPFDNQRIDTGVGLGDEPFGLSPIPFWPPAPEVQSRFLEA